MAENKQDRNSPEEATALCSEASTISVSSNPGENLSKKKNVGGIMYVERLNSFKNVWPYVKKSDTCTPHNLAMAGLVYEGSEPTCKARCFVCYKIFDDLKGNTDPCNLTSVLPTSVTNLVNPVPSRRMVDSLIHLLN
ncbi:unnamed protein product [Allacma fusca]|uniref:Uncharacterized protein n=1 Tax=Allacma fusca TaxID=39272 RepID=A0A8J2PLZ5_9HEXA|nr:unnamed protein product [Allacma fusca]